MTRVSLLGKRNSMLKVNSRKIVGFRQGVESHSSRSISAPKKMSSPRSSSAIRSGSGKVAASEMSVVKWCIKPGCKTNEPVGVAWCDD